MVAVSTKIFNGHLRVRNPLLDQSLDLMRVHCHQPGPSLPKSATVALSDATTHVVRKPALMRVPQLTQGHAASSGQRQGIPAAPADNGGRNIRRFRSVQQVA